MIRGGATVGSGRGTPSGYPLVRRRFTTVRPGVQARAARPDDLDDLVHLCMEARKESGMGAQLCTDDAERMRRQVGALLAVEGGLVLVGTLDEQPAGLLLARVVGPGPFTDATTLALEAVFVMHTARRRGLGHALLAAAAQAAEEHGAVEVYASPLPGARGMQRFLARLGFAPAAAFRVAGTAALQRRLAHDPAAVGPAVRRGAPRGLEDLIARRRQARAARQPGDDAITARHLHVERAVPAAHP